MSETDKTSCVRVSVDVEKSQYVYKKEHGLTWNGIISRGINSELIVKENMELKYNNDELKNRIEKMADLLKKYTTMEVK